MRVCKYAKHASMQELKVCAYAIESEISFNFKTGVLQLVSKALNPKTSFTKIVTLVMLLMNVYSKVKLQLGHKAVIS